MTADPSATRASSDGSYTVQPMHIKSDNSGASSATARSPAAGETPSTTPEPTAADVAAAAAAAKVGAVGAGSTSAVDIAYSVDACMIATATEDKQVRVWRTGVVVDASHNASKPMAAAPAPAPAAAGELLGQRELPKKPTSLLFAPVATAVAPAGGGGKGKAQLDEVLVVSDKCGDAYAAPLPDPSSSLKHLLGHTAMTITATALLKEGALLATADRAEHIRVSQVTFSLFDC